MPFFQSYAFYLLLGMASGALAGILVMCFLCGKALAEKNDYISQLRVKIIKLGGRESLED